MYVVTKRMYFIFIQINFFIILLKIFRPKICIKLTNHIELNPWIEL